MSVIDTLNPILMSVWGETVNRLDSLLHEIRHTQMNLIRELREEGLYEILRYEERYLWGQYQNTSMKEEESKTGNDVWGSWFEFLEEHGLIYATEISNAWIINLEKNFTTEHPYKDSSPGANDGFQSCFGNYFCSDDYESAAAYANKIYTTRDLYRGYGPILTQTYKAFCALQSLKRNILRDKIIFSFWADKIKNTKVPLYKPHKNSQGDDTNNHDIQINDVSKKDIVSIGRFFTVRAGILFRMQNYINRFGDLKVPVTRTADLSVTDSLRPTTTRRKEQGAYNDFLTQRSRRYLRVIEEMLRKTKDIKQNERQGDVYLNQRWSHDASSRFASFTDETTLEIHPELQYKISHHYLNMSFWMIDRPDLQPIIAHEIAHYYVSSVFKDIGEAELQSNEGEFSDLFRKLSKVFYFFANPDFADDSFPLDNLETLKEFAADLLSAQRNGISYLWALFLELIGNGLHRGLETPNSQCDLTMLEEAESYGFILQNQDISPLYSSHFFSVRLIGLCAFIENSDIQYETNPVATQLIKSVKLITQIVIKYVEDHTPLMIMNGRGIKFHDQFINTIYNTIAEHPVCDTIREDQESLNDTSRENQFSSVEEYHDGELFFGLDWRTSLVDWLFKLKTKRQKELGACIKFDKEYFVKNYISKNLPKSSALTSTQIIENYNIFQSIHDVGWTSFVFRGVDLCLLIENSTVTGARNQYVYETYSHFEPGVDLYHASHEYQMWLRSSPKRRLARVLRFLIDTFSEITDEFQRINSNGNFDVSSTETDHPEKQKFPEVWAKICGVHPNEISTKTWRDACALIYDQLLPDLFSWTYCDNLNIDDSVFSGSGIFYKIRDLTDKYNEDLAEIFINTGSDHSRKKPTQLKSQQKLYSLKKTLSANLGLFKERSEGITKEAVSKFSLLHEYLVACSTSSNEFENKNKSDELINHFDFVFRADTEPMPPVAITRLSTAARRIAQKETPYIEGYKNLQRQSAAAISQQSMLGRNDLIIFTKEPFHKQAIIPDVDSLWSTGKLKPFSMRSERAFPLGLSQSTIPTDTHGNLVAFIDIVLTGRDARLDFFQLLVGELSQRRPFATLNVSEHINPNRDFFLLPEGRADISIGICGNIYERMESIFVIQKALRNHFLVEQTETIFSSDSLRYFLASSPDHNTIPEDISLAIQIRLRSDRNLNPTISKIENHLKHCETILELNSQSDTKIFWRRTAGRLDYELFIPKNRLASVLRYAERKCNSYHEKNSNSEFDPKNPLNYILTLCGLFDDDSRFYFNFEHLIDEIITRLGHDVHLD